jgi:hypothetical protein
MPNEHDLVLAIMNIGRADTGGGGLVPLTGNKTVPIIQFGDLARADSEGTDVEHSPPIVAVTVVTNDPYRGSNDSLDAIAQLDAFADRRSEGLHAQMMDRVEQILTGANFTIEGLDVRVAKGIRRPLDEFESGRKRLSQDYFLFVRR